ncbi:MAG: hypothetical protein AB8E15_13705 [Bdellovibrionales bacterium]
MAQMYALKSEKETIYKLRIPRNRVIIDTNNLGNTGRHGEILIIGRIFPHEIIGVKIKNSSSKSELLDTIPATGTRVIRTFPRIKNIRYEVRNPKNWKSVN